MTALEVADDTISSDDGISAPFLQSADSVFDLANAKQSLNNAIYAAPSFDTCRRRLSLSSLVVDLALRLACKPSSST
ncbi:hypothetical protein SCLCIDRAFT_1208373 [Scleroderma citrinum Foug A]|uniref:Uncharacterized protein n=1 Tax=Scleroderma citrinum Foug A TaxID=1036808 RepID=A0A0C3EPN7_9AGAM|nr:hypothetical protein SCLCIDRAFT_1208373 [Scleroderma citrinum Foug A]